MATARKPRVRKTAPTVRERAEAARLKAETPQRPSRLKRTASTVVSLAVRPLRKLRLPSLPDNRFGRISRRILSWITPRYFINSWRELKQVTWPSRSESWRLTGAVFVFATVFGGLVWSVDKILDILFKNLVLK